MSSEAAFGCGDPPPAELFAEIWRRHGHRCPMSTLGGRLGHAATRLLGAENGAALRAHYRIRTCAVDGIAVATGCALTDGTLQVVEEGAHQLHLTDGLSGRRATVEIRPETLELAASYRRIDSALEQERDGLVPEVLQRRLAERERLLDELLVRLCTRPEQELLLLELSQGRG